MGILNFLMSRKSAMQPQPANGAKGNANEVSNIGARSVTMDMDTYLASDEKEWLRYLAQPIRTYRKPGLSMREEHQLWLSARERSRVISGGARSRAS